MSIAGLIAFSYDITITMETTTESQLEEGSAKWHIRNIEAMSIEEMVKFSALRLDEVKKELELLEREVEGFEKEEREEREEEEVSYLVDWFIEGG